MTELRVNPPELGAGASGLEDAANSIPEPPAAFTSTGTDALSAILSTLTQEKESPLIAGMPATKSEALATVQKILQAAGIYEQTDQQIADEVRRATEGLDSAAGGAPGGGGAGQAGGVGAPGAGGANAAVGAGQLQQMMGMPMQMAQQVPQGITQGVQSGMQQVSQLAGGMVQKDDSQAGDEQQPSQARDEKPDDKDKGRHAAPEGAAPGTNNAERAPEAAPPKHAQAPPAGTDPGIVL
jgi:hypothetical protein